MQHRRKVSFPIDGLPHYVKIRVTIVTVHHKSVIPELIHNLHQHWGLLGQNKSHQTGTSCTNCSVDSQAFEKYDNHNIEKWGNAKLLSTHSSRAEMTI